MTRLRICVPACLLVWLFCFAPHAAGQLCNLKVVTDASPDYSDMPAMVRSITSRWESPEEKCYAVFYWNHIARRQTNPISLHGMALTDPIRQFNDYGYMMCSTISGANQAIWRHMGLPHRYWDISNHTVAEVFYDGRWHMYDNSLSALYTLCDGKTIAAVEDIGREGACEASGHKREAGHIAKYHCLTATSPNGFLIGADCARSLDEEYRCFNPNGLKLRTYFYDWDFGHRYILNFRPGETYTRHYRSLGDSPDFYVPNHGKDPEAVNKRYRLRANGVWEFAPSLKRGEVESLAHGMEGAIALPAGGISPAEPGKPASITFKVNAANVITSQRITALIEGGAGDRAKLLVSRDNGMNWKELATPASREIDLRIVEEVNGAYEVLVRVELAGQSSLRLSSLKIVTTTNLNSKTQPRLNLGRNTVHVGAGDQTDSIVFWPELQGNAYKRMIVEENNVASLKEHPGYQGVLHPATPNQDAYVVYRLDAPRDITRLTYGGRFYNRAAKSRIEIQHSFDAGQTWTRTWTLTETSQPWDVIHYETVQVPRGIRSVLVKYLMNSPDASQSGCSIYAVRMEANHLPAEVAGRPLVVQFAWNEVQADRSQVRRSHTQVVASLPLKYTINVGGADHPIMESLSIRLAEPGENAAPGYSDGKDVGSEKFVGQWVMYGKNLAVGRPYTCSVPSLTSWDAGDPDGTKLTDGVAGPPYSGGISYRYGLIWNDKTNPIVTVNLGEIKTCTTFGLNFHGYPWHDALKGEVQDKVEVFVSEDGQAYRSLGFLNTDLRWKDLPANHMWPDEETIAGHTFRLIPPEPVRAQFVQYKISPARMMCATEIEILDAIRFEPFDLRLALPE